MLAGIAPVCAISCWMPDPNNQPFGTYCLYDVIGAFCTFNYYLSDDCTAVCGNGHKEPAQ